MPGRIAHQPSPDGHAHLSPILDPGEDVWASIALPTVDLLATDRRLLRLHRERVEAWEYGDIRHVGPAGVDGDVAISFRDGTRPIVVHAKGNDPALQALTVIGLLVARSNQPGRQRARR